MIFYVQNFTRLSKFICSGDTLGFSVNTHKMNLALSLCSRAAPPLPLLEEGVKTKQKNVSGKKIMCKQNSPPPYAAEEGKKYITDNLLNFMLLT